MISLSLFLEVRERERIKMGGCVCVHENDEEREARLPFPTISAERWSEDGAGGSNRLGDEKGVQ